MTSRSRIAGACALMLAALAVAPASRAQVLETVAQAGGTEADHTALREALKQATAAINDAKFDALKPLLYRKFSMTMINQELVGTPAELDDFLKRWFTGPNRLVKSHKMVPAVNELTQIIDGRVGIARGTNDETYEMMRGVSFTFKSRWTATLVKDEGTWKLAAIHSGIDFTDNPVLRAAAGSATWFGFGGLITGVLGTALVSRLLRRRTA